MKNIQPEDVEKTVIISEQEAKTVGGPAPVSGTPAAGAQAPAPAQEEPAGDVRRSILSDLGNFLFPHRRTLVDETLELICSGNDVPVSAAPRAPEGELMDVNEFYSVDGKSIAVGGQGSIRKAVDRSLGCVVAVKTLHEKLCSDEQARESFINEAKLTASLDHPAIIPIHGLFSDGGKGMHLAMKMISGHTLSDYMKGIVDIYEKKGISRFDERKSLYNRIEIFLRVCDAMEHAHSRGIIHRDLKLENVMIGRHRETYVTDWGLALKLEEAEDLPKVTGTPGFIAPEVLVTRKADIRSDIYSLGIILFEMVTLRPAFPKVELAELLTLVKQGRHVPLRHRFGCRIDADLRAIILKAIDVDPDKRYQEVKDLSADLRRYLVNEETTARPDSLFTRVARWGVNHRRGMLTATMIILLFGIAAVARTLYREMKWSTELRLRDNVVGSVYSEATAAAAKLSRDLERIEYQAEQLRTNILFSSMKVRSVPDPGKRFFVPVEEYVTSPPPGYVYAESYRHRIDPDTACVFNYRGGRPDMKELRYFGNTAQFMRQAVLSPGEGGEKKAVERLLRQGCPIMSIYFALTDGTFACYPGSRDDFPSDYFPPSRPWYKQALEAGGRLVWSVPYQDSGVNGETVLTCSSAVYDADRKLIGVAGIDFSLTNLARTMLENEGRYARFTSERMLIDSRGNILLRMVPSRRIVAVPFNDVNLIRRMVRRKSGTILTEQHGREMLLVFAYLKAVDLLYVEYLDVAVLVDYWRQSVPEERWTVRDHL
ncbi:MAG: protein kinase [Lentisphaeria bacterium]|nr:protein kinase [Lentisphaeria bacterium]